MRIDLRCRLRITLPWPSFFEFLPTHGQGRVGLRNSHPTQLPVGSQAGYPTGIAFPEQEILTLKVGIAFGSIYKASCDLYITWYGARYPSVGANNYPPPTQGTGNGYPYRVPRGIVAVYTSALFLVGSQRTLSLMSSVTDHTSLYVSIRQPVAITTNQRQVFRQSGVGSKSQVCRIMVVMVGSEKIVNGQ